MTSASPRATLFVLDPGQGEERNGMAEIPNAVIKRLLTKHGDGLRVSGSALDKAVAAKIGRAHV